METSFLGHLSNKTVIALAMGFLTAIIVLVLTLNLMAAVVVLIMTLVTLIFQNTYSRGWLFLLGVLLLFPSIRLNEQGVLLNDLMLAALAMIGLINLMITKFKYPENNLFYEFFLLSLCGFSILSFGYILRQNINYDIWRITITLLLIWIVLVAFQYYFQTLRRIRRFFFLLMIVGIMHAVFGLIMFTGGWQTATGMGISNGKNYTSIFGTINHQINGFLGIGLAERMRSNALTPLLLISITSTVGFLLVERKKYERENNTKLLPEELFLQKQGDTGDQDPSSIRIAARDASLYVRSLSKKELFLYAAVIVQTIALYLTLADSSIIFLAIGLLVLGMLDRNKRLMWIASIMIILFALVLPSFISTVAVRSSQNLLNWFDGFSIVQQNWLIGAGWRSLSSDAATVVDRIRNSYLYIWNDFGILGLLILVSMLAKYFKDLYLGYIKSDGTKRVWLMVIIAIFIQIILEAMTGNVLFYGPAALVFWLLYGAAMNLRRKPVIHGLTESKLLDI